MTCPSGDDCPTGGELAERVLEPWRLCRDGTHFFACDPGHGASVAATAQARGDRQRARAGQPFRLVVRGRTARSESSTPTRPRLHRHLLESPTPGRRRHPGAGRDSRSRPHPAHIPDPRSEPSIWAGKTLLVVGCRPLGADRGLRLADFAAEHPGHAVLWALRGERAGLADRPDDPLPERSALTARAADSRAGPALPSRRSGASWSSRSLRTRRDRGRAVAPRRHQPSPVGRPGRFAHRLRRRRVTLPPAPGPRVLRHQRPDETGRSPAGQARPTAWPRRATAPRPCSTPSPASSSSASSPTAAPRAS